MMKFWSATSFGLLVACLSFSGNAVHAGEEPLHTVDVTSASVVIDRAYKSMEGPGGLKKFKLAQDEKPELLWVTGGKVELFNAGTKTKQSKAQVCHANLRFDPRQFEAHNPNADLKHMTNQQVKLFSFVEGQPEIRLPKGFGIPVLSTKLFEFNFGTMNPAETKQPFSIQAGATFQYFRDSELKQELKPLFMRIVSMKVPVQKGAGHPANCPMLKEADFNDEETEDTAAPAEQSLKTINKNESGYEQAYHWMVPPGRHTYHYRLEKNNLRNLPFDTTIHYINAHLHPLAEFIELRDVTTGKSLFKGRVKNSKDGASITKLDSFSSKKGMPIYRDHEYELVCQYNNTTGHDIDAMALMFVYLLDKNFDRARLKSLMNI